MPNELKPCPFCGEKEDIDYGIYNGTLKGFDYVQCQTCGATINAIHKNEYIAAEKLWNDRADGPQKGEWIAEYERQGNYSHCSLCECRCAGYVPNYKFCPNCGADMRKDENT